MTKNTANCKELKVIFIGLAHCQNCLDKRLLYVEGCAKMQHVKSFI